MNVLSNVCVCVSLLITVNQIESYSSCKIVPNRYTRKNQLQNWNTQNKFLYARDSSEYDEDDMMEIQGTQDYFPTSGIETFISTISSRRALLPSEYECSFVTYPVLKERYLAKKFPERDLEESEEVDRWSLAP